MAPHVTLCQKNLVLFWALAASASRPRNEKMATNPWWIRSNLLGLPVGLTCFSVPLVHSTILCNEELIFYQLDGDGDPPPHTPTSEPSLSPSPTTSPTPSSHNVAFSQPSPPVTPPRLSRPYNHPPPLSPTADSELVRIPVNPAPSHFCCHCRTECPCIFGRPCRGCPARLGGRPHWCKRCPGSWCHNKPMNIPWSNLVIISVCDALPEVFFQC